MTDADQRHDFRCRLCHGTAGECRLRAAANPDWDILRCRACHFLSLRKPPPPETLATFYQESYYREADGSRFTWPFEAVARAFRRQRARKLRRWLPTPPASVLDVGCGRAVFLAALKERGYKVHGTQLSATAAAYARRTFGIDVFVGELAQAPYGEAAFDLVTLWHVLEHLPDPRACLERVHALLKPGGALLVEVPNAASWTACWGGRRWLHWDLPRHLGHFTPETLGPLLDSSGFEVVSRSFFSLEYGPFGVVQTILNFLPGQPNLFFERLKGRGPRWRGAAFFLHAAVAAILAVPALAYSALAAACGRGDILTLRCRKR